MACCKSIERAKETIQADVVFYEKKILNWCDQQRSDINRINSFLSSKKMIFTHLCVTQPRPTDNEQLDEINALYTQVTTFVKKLTTVVLDIRDSEKYKKEWMKMTSSFSKGEWCEVVSGNVGIIEDISDKFQNDRFRNTRPTILDDLAHKAEKSRLMKCFHRIQTEMQLLQQHKGRLHNALAQWTELFREDREQLDSMESKIADLFKKYESLYKFNSTHLDKDCIDRITTLQSTSSANSLDEAGVDQSVMLKKLLEMLNEVDNCNKYAEEEREYIQLLEETNDIIKIEE